MRAWSLISNSGVVQYAGNIGWSDDPRSIYRYDSDVANHLQLAVGDIVVIRDAATVSGIAIVDTISESVAVKSVHRCPSCRTTSLKTRRNASPKYRCNNGHTFAEPDISEKKVTQYEAHFGSSYVPLPDLRTVSELKAIALRPNDQISIEELDARRLPDVLAPSPVLDTLLAGAFQASVPGLTTSPEVETDAYVPSRFDTRIAIVRSIVARRGQARFRQALMQRYGACCLVSGCNLSEILEAAHIWPYRGNDDNHVDNGLLLRADLHTMFDLDLLGINPADLAVTVAASATEAGYSQLNGKILAIGKSAGPSKRALEQRWQAFQARNRMQAQCI